MKKLSIIALLILFILSSIDSESQIATMDQIPTVRQTTSQNSGNNPSLGSIVSGNILVTIYTETSSIATPTIASSCGDTWSSPIAAGAGGAFIWVWKAVATCSGTDTITVTRSGQTAEKTSLLEIAHSTGVIDVSITGTASAGGGTLTLPNITTTRYNDLLLEIAVGNFVGAGATNNGAYTINGNENSFTLGGFNSIYMQSRLSGNPGLISGSVLQVGSGGGSSSQVVIAFRAASGITISTPALPDAVVGQTYSFPLGAVDGIGTNIWSITSGVLPCGLSLSSSGVISGTPTCSNGNVIRFTVTDSGANSNFADLTLQVATSINTPVRIQSTNGIGGTTLNGTVAGRAIFVGIVNSTNFAQSLLRLLSLIVVELILLDYLDHISLWQVISFMLNFISAIILVEGIVLYLLVLV